MQATGKQATRLGRKDKCAHDSIGWRSVVCENRKKQARSKTVIIDLDESSVCVVDVGQQLKIVLSRLGLEAAAF